VREVKEGKELSTTALKAISNYEDEGANQSEIPAYPESIYYCERPLEWSDGYLSRVPRSY